MTPKELWDQALSSLKLQLGERVWSTWLQGSSVSYQRGSELVVRVKDEYAAEWCDARLRPAIDRTIVGLAKYEGSTVKTVRFVS